MMVGVGVMAVTNVSGGPRKGVVMLLFCLQLTSGRVGGVPKARDGRGGRDGAGS